MSAISDTSEGSPILPPNSTGESPSSNGADERVQEVATAKLDETRRDLNEARKDILEGFVEGTKCLLGSAATVGFTATIFSIFVLLAKLTGSVFIAGIVTSCFPIGGLEFAIVFIAFAPILLGAGIGIILASLHSYYTQGLNKQQ